MKAITVTSATTGYASGTLTSDNVAAPSSGDTVTVGGKTYTFRTALTPAEGEVLIAGSVANALTNLIRAINHTGTPDTDYKCAAANAQVSAGTLLSSTHFVATALSPGLAGNSIATTASSAHLSWGGAALSGGEAVTILGTVAETTFGVPASQTTVAKVPAANSAWSRAFRVSSQAVTCVRNGAASVAVLVDSFAKLAVAVEPSLTWLPRFSSQPADGSVTYGADQSFSAAQNSQDELAASLKWQRSADGGATWVDIAGASSPSDGQSSYSGYATGELTVAAPTVAMSGYKYRCAATTAAGVSYSQAASLSVAKAAPDVSSWPTASGITTGQDLTHSTLSGGSATPAGSFGWTAPSTVPAAGTTSQSVTYTPSDTANYTTAVGSASVTAS